MRGPCFKPRAIWAGCKLSKPCLPDIIAWVNRSYSGVTVSAQHTLVEFYQQRTDAIVHLITRLANFETPTSSKVHVDALGREVESILHGLDATVTRFPKEQVGDILLAKWNADASDKPILFMMHMDTVWGLGTLAERPVHVENNRLIGPGTWDMKGSIALVLSVVQGLRDRGAFPNRPIWAMFTTDEETGSLHSVNEIEAAAKQAGLCLVMEFAATNGGLKTWRKGIAHYQLSVTGKAPTRATRQTKASTRWLNWLTRPFG